MANDTPEEVAAERYGTTVEIFEDESVLKEDWQPEKLPEREAELDRINEALAPATRGINADNLFVYGKTGQGKSVAIDHELDILDVYAEMEDDMSLSIIKTSAQNQSTSYQLTAHIIKEIWDQEHAPSGINQQSMFDLLYKELKQLNETIIIVIDEIDSIGSNDAILYELPRARKNGHLPDKWISVIGISNDLEFRDNLSPKVKDSLYDAEVEFSSYNADQLESILERRADRAFVEGVLSDDVIPLCAAFAAQDEGSARQAIKLLSWAGRLALSQEDSQVVESHVRDAREELERSQIEESMRNLTVQDQLSLLAVVALEVTESTPARTRGVYEKYKAVAERRDSNTITQRNMRDHLQELAMLGFLTMKKRQDGIQGGPHYIFELKTNLEMTLNVLAEDGDIEEIVSELEDIASMSGLV